MRITNEISPITLLVPHYGLHNEITEENVSFKVYKEDEWIKVIPLLSEEERSITGLPEEVLFTYVNHCVVTADDIEEETLDVIKKIILELQVQQLV